MNREIKFRAWDKEEKKMNYFDLMDLWHDMADGNCDDEVMQFTGLHDKNGKEIYEGDIVKTDEGFIGLVEFGRFPYVANIEDYGYFIKAHEYFKLTANTCQAVEVIGNIYESPQLLDNTDTKE